MHVCANTACMDYSSVTEAGLYPVTVSIVSHGQGEMVTALLRDLALCVGVHKVLVTHNIPEREIACPESLRPRLVLIRNDHPKGFAANHNQAFGHCTTSLFVILNPDIRLPSDPFPVLMNSLADNQADLIAPMVRNPEGGLEDSARHFPTPGQLLAKLLKRGDGRITATGDVPVEVDWVAGMFMLFRSDTFRSIGGFDEGFFLYYEDVDICARLWKTCHRIVLHPAVFVIHAAQRASRRSLPYMAWHLSSMARYFLKHLGRQPLVGKGS